MKSHIMYAFIFLFNSQTFYTYLYHFIKILARYVTRPMLCVTLETNHTTSKICAHLTSIEMKLHHESVRQKYAFLALHQAFGRMTNLKIPTQLCPRVKTAKVYQTRYSCTIFTYAAKVLLRFKFPLPPFTYAVKVLL